MPIATTNAKLAIIEFGQIWEPGLPISPGALGQDDKQQLLHGYPDVLWGDQVAPVEVSVESLGANDRRYLYRGQRLTRAELEREYTKRAAEKRAKARAQDLERALEKARQRAEQESAPVQARAPAQTTPDVGKLIEDIGARVAAMPAPVDEDEEAIYAIMTAVLMEDAA